MAEIGKKEAKKIAVEIGWRMNSLFPNPIEYNKAKKIVFKIANPEMKKELIKIWAKKN